MAWPTRIMVTLSELAAPVCTDPPGPRLGVQTGGSGGHRARTPASP